jgi:hydroxymethylpyrimidine pyrophosphatase-like HAD family hydrolase
VCQCSAGSLEHTWLIDVVGLQVLLQHLQLSPEQLMAVGDGSNDLEMVSHAGIGVAMGNAVPSVKSAAAYIVSSNDDGGISEAFERFIL